MATQPDPRMFPPAHDLLASWAPIYLEPMLGSGERFVAAVVAVDPRGAFHVERTVRAKTLRCMYGDQGDVVLAIADLVVDSLQDYLAMGGQLAEWIPPVHTCLIGPVRDALGPDLSGIALRGASLTASLYGKGIADVLADPDDLATTSPDVDRWFQQIRDSVRIRKEPLDVRFNREVRVRTNASATRIGYLGDRIAANFDLLVPGPQLSNRRFRSKARLVDLQILKDQVDLFQQRTTYELMLWVPERHSPAFSERHIENVYAALSELEEFADKHELRVQALHNASDAAERIVSLESTT